MIGKTARQILEEEIEMKKQGEEIYLQKKFREEDSKDPKTPTEDLRGFIFDKEEIIKKKVFTSHRLDENTFGFGMLLPKWIDVFSKKGDVVSKEQEWKPIIITSDRRGIVVSKKIETDLKINYEAIPVEMKLRWELFALDSYLHGDEQVSVEGIDLFKNIKEQYEKYCFYRTNDWYDVNPLWDIATYLYQLFPAFPIKEERGLKGTAKTKTMIISSNITLNATENL